MNAPSDRPVALVTGGAVRVGRTLALGLASDGFDIGFAYHSSVNEAAEVRDRIEALGRRCVMARANVGDPEQIRDLVAEVAGELGRIDLLVNNAALFRTGSILDVSVEEWDEVMAVNLRAPFLMVKEAAPRLADASGSVVNVVDLSAFEPWTRYPHHAVSKAGLLHLTRVMARSLAPRIRVNAVAPGTVVPPPGMSDEELDRERRRALVGRLGSADDVLDAVRYLHRATFVTGEVIVVDGGRSLTR